MSKIRNKFYFGLVFLAFLIPAPLFVTGQTGGNSQFQTDQPVRLLVVTDRISDTLGGGKVVFINEVDTTGSLKYLLVTMEGESWYAEAYPSLKSLMENPMPYRDWAVWVHGDGQSFEISLERAREIQALHKVNFIVFSWPTLAPDKGPINNFKYSRNNALLTVPFLHAFLHEIDHYRKMEYNRIQAGHLSIFFHSLACYMLNEALERGYLQDMSVSLFDNLIINQAATSSVGHADWVERLKIQKQVYIIFNDGDVNLAGFRVLFGQGYQLGERPLPPLAMNAIYLDFTGSVGFRLPTGATHSFYYATVAEKSSNIRETFSILFQGYQLRFADPVRFETTEEPQVFKVLF